MQHNRCGEAAQQDIRSGHIVQLHPLHGANAADVQSYAAQGFRSVEMVV